MVLLQVLLILSVVLYTSLTIAMHKPFQPLHTLALALGVSIASAFISFVVLCIAFVRSMTSGTDTSDTSNTPVAEIVWPQVPPPETHST